MDIVIKRFADNKNATISAMYINGDIVCFGVEDEERKTKVAGETRVPEDIYKVGLRSEGSFHEKYLDKFGEDFHKGMICIYNAPDWKIVTETMEFQYVLMHCGNTEKDTAGCYLVNTSVNAETFTGSDSVKAYKKVYPIIADALLAGEEVTWQFINVEH